MHIEAEVQLQVQTIVAEGMRKGLSPKVIGKQLIEMLDELGGMGAHLLSTSSYIRYVAKEVLELDGRHN